MSIKGTWRAITSLPVDNFPLILPDVHPIAAFFILKRLKRLGYSGCKVSKHGTDLVVYAHK